MHYRLGPLVPNPGVRALASQFSLRDTSGVLTSALEEIPNVRLTRDHPVLEGPFELRREAELEFARRLQDAAKRNDTGAMLEVMDETVRHERAARNSRCVELPDLLESLPPDHSDRAWATTVAERLAAFPGGIRLLACHGEDGPNGFLTIAATTASVIAEVRPRDAFQPGFVAMRKGNASVKLWPRIFRLVCSNGSLVYTAEGADLLEQGMTAGQALDACFDRGRFEAALACMKSAAGTGLADPRRLMDEMGDLSHREAVEIAFHADGDATVYGLINATTAVARDLDDPRERLELEELAGRIAWLMRPTGARVGVAAADFVEV